MTETELAAVIHGITPVLREYVAKEISDLATRLTAAEVRVQMLGDLRDRVVTVETKAATLPPPPDLTDVRDRVLVLETKASAPAPVVTVAPPAQSVSVEDVASVRERIVALETRSDLAIVDLQKQLTALAHTVDKDSSRLEGYSAALQRDLAEAAQRLAIVEVRPPIPGPPGEPGAPGQDGKDGEPGAAGLSFEGVYQDGKAYDLGHLVTWGGSSWHCNETTTTKPGDGSKAWTLMVKRGRDGKDGRDGHDAALPVVSVGRTS